MKKDLCSEVRAASANRMHSAALLRNWAKLGKCASISVHMGTDRALCPKNDSRSKIAKRRRARSGKEKKPRRSGAQKRIVSAPSKGRLLPSKPGSRRGLCHDRDLDLDLCHDPGHHLYRDRLCRRLWRPQMSMSRCRQRYMRGSTPRWCRDSRRRPWQPPPRQPGPCCVCSSSFAALLRFLWGTGRVAPGQYISVERH